MATADQQDILDSLAEAGAELAASFFANSCDILRKQEVRDQGLGKTTTWATAHEDVPCLVTTVKPGSNAERLVGERLTTSLLYKVSLALGTDVTSEDRLKLADGRTLGVLAVPTSTFQALTVAYCVEIA